MAEPEEVIRGTRFVIYAVKDSADAEPLLVQFMRQMRSEDQKKLWALLKHTADYGPPRNPQRCRKIAGEENLFELKSKPFRVFFFYWGREEGRGRIVVTHAFQKRSDKTPPRQIDRALRLREAVLSSIDRGETRHQGDSRNEASR